ncbi:hypothetical protein M408DRAFT_27893 [Serendipita vermifera MAFF 305830]|uniref:Uncharacterized protein n=1 Tax=Serendipita vermifera MAFF 305830 TaxID=933852 RepID=A0A0C3ATV9_SERVB|nr:hypothetical protein M408DRAFT_27893 [Serendipita vermifera MAFF 305830]
MRFFSPKLVLLFVAATALALPIISPEQTLSLEKRGGPGDASGSGSGKGKGLDNRPPSPAPPSVGSTPPNSRPSSPTRGDVLRLGPQPPDSRRAPPVPRLTASAVTAPKREVQNIPGGRNEALARLEGNRPSPKDPSVRNAANAAANAIANRQRQNPPNTVANRQRQDLPNTIANRRPAPFTATDRQRQAQVLNRVTAQIQRQQQVGSNIQQQRQQGGNPSRWSGSSGGR